MKPVVIMVLFQALTWEARDSDDEYLVSIFGRDGDGNSVCLTTPFMPYFFVKLSKMSNDRALFANIQNATKNAAVNYELVRSRDVWGFQNNEKFVFMKLNFQTLEAMKRCDRRLQRPLDKDDVYTLRVYESNVDPVLRFMHRSGIQSTGWLDTGKRCVKSHLAHVKYDLFCNDWKDLTPQPIDANAPFVVASFDIETYSSTGKFPDADVKDDACFQIAFTLKRIGEDEIYEKTCLCYKDTDTNLDGSNIVNFSTEKDLIMGFKEYLLKHDIDIMTGWNIFGFDLEYIYKRAIITQCDETFYYLGKLKDQRCEMSYKKLSSSALGDNLLKLLPMSGRYIFDLFQDIKREKKLDSYKLDFVAETYLGDHKIDMTPKEMFARFREEDPVKLREVAEYCIKDTILPHQIMDKLCSLLNLLEMAKATWVPICYLSERGQQIKVFSQMTRKARELGYMVPTIRWGKIVSDPYEGATVLEAQTGAYYTPITALDFAALYPSIMMAHNLCYSTLVMDPRYENVSGVEYESFKIGDKTYKFAQNVDSLLPAVLMELKQFRKQAKKDMADATGIMKDVYNGKQLAYKISMNSVYGFTGAGKGMLPCVPIASTVTAKGRSMIEETKNYVEAHFPGANVRYGDTDSVMVEFDTTGMSPEQALEHSWKLGEQAATECTALFKKPNDLELEKVYYPYFLYSKKRYAAKLWTKGKDGNMHMDYIDVKGIQVVRRDNTPHVREVCTELLDIILESKNPDGAINLAKQRATELLTGQVPIDKLILSQKLADSYKSQNMAHVQVRNKMREREPGSEPQSGDRVQYVLVDTGNSKARAYEKSDDPKYVKANNIPLDYKYYLENKFMNPVCDLLEPLVENPKQEIFAELLPKKKTRGKQQNTIDDAFAKHDIKQKARKTIKKNDE